VHQLECVMISGALTLLTNAVITYNTWKLHQILERRKECGRPVPSTEILAHIAPIAFRHINFNGTYRFSDRSLPRPTAPFCISATGNGHVVTGVCLSRNYQTCPQETAPICTLR
jgi:Tn3 transposase DDE domain